MYCLIDENNKVILWYSAKCGCTFIKTLFCELTEKKFDHLPNIHFIGYEKFDLKYLNGYTHVLFIRNPYKRLISGFLDKYCYNQNLKIDHITDLTFGKFVDELYTNGLKNIDIHHFTPQFSEEYDERLDSKFSAVYNIENINYDYIFQLFKKRVDIEQIKKISKEHNVIQKNNIDNAHQLTVGELNEKLPLYKNFFTDDIKKKIQIIYKIDFLKMEKFQHHYTI